MIRCYYHVRDIEVEPIENEGRNVIYIHQESREKVLELIHLHHFGMKQSPVEDNDNQVEWTCKFEQDLMQSEPAFL